MQHALYPESFLIATSDSKPPESIRAPFAGKMTDKSCCRRFRVRQYKVDFHHEFK
jgi:hypothetical protein